MAASIPVQEAAEKLVLHTVEITSNINNFPKKYRYTLVDRLIRTSMDIHDSICDANNQYNGEKRTEYIEQAISDCRKIKFYIKLVYKKLHPQCSVEYWNSMVKDIEKQLQNWRIDTIKRTKK